MAIMDQVKQAMDRREVNPNQLAKMIGTSPATMYFYLAGEKKPGTDVLHRIADALECEWKLDDVHLAQTK